MIIYEKTVNTVLKSCINFVWMDYLERTPPQILIMTRQQAFLKRDEVCLVNEISIELQPFNILNVHSEEILEISSCHLRCKLPWALRFWRAKRSHPCKYGNCSSVPFVCLFSFVWMFFFSPLSLWCFCQHILLPGERDGGRDSLSLCSVFLHMWEWDSLYFLLHLHIIWHCSLFSLPLTRTQNQAVAAQICPEPKHSDYVFGQNWL